MTFPESPRVVYKKNPLDQVICQVRYPTIFRLDEEAPASFQETIREKYPLVETKESVDLAIPKEVAQVLPTPMVESAMKRKKEYSFTDKNGNWTIGLNSDYIALTTNRYTRWEEFKEHLQEPLTHFINIYKPPFFTRVGLRYMDVIAKSTLGLEAEWRELIQPYIAGTLSLPDMADRIQDQISIAVISMKPQEFQVRLQQGLVKHNETGEICYLVDSDFFTLDGQQIEVDDGINKLNAFNEQARRLFRWCITDKLHMALEPVTI